MSYRLETGNLMLRIQKKTKNKKREKTKKDV
jgi:hypothetical protein